MKRFVYADNAATTRLDERAFEAMRPFLTEEFGNASQPYAFAREPKRALRRARETIASCIGAEPEEIFFTSGGTESDNWAIKSVALFVGRDGSIVTSRFEHHAVLHACAAVERLGCPVFYAEPDADGVVTSEAVEQAMPSGTKLVSVMYANNELGTIQPVQELCDAAHSRGALFHTDAVQAVGHVRIDVRKLGVDMLSASAHKFNGPKGVGFLYVRRGLALAPYADGGAQESGRRAGTENVAGIVGMATALESNCAALDENAARVSDLGELLIGWLHRSGVEFVRNGGAPRLPGLLSLSFPGADGEALLHRLDLAGICVSTGSACNGAATEASHVLRAIRLEERLARGTIRVSLGKDNTAEDMNAIVKALVKIFGA